MNMGYTLIGWQKFDLRGPMPPTWLLTLVCYTRILLYAKMLKETETEKNIPLVVILFIIVFFIISIGGRFYPPPSWLCL